MSAITSNEVLRLQSSNRLLDSDTLSDRRYSSSEIQDKTLSLLSPCTSLRQLLECVDPRKLAARGDFASGPPPYPLYDIFKPLHTSLSSSTTASCSNQGPVTPYQSYLEYQLRHTACILNEAQVNIERTCKDALDWYKQMERRDFHIPPLASTRLLTLSHKQVALIQDQEPVPKALRIADQSKTSSPYIRLDFQVEGHGAHAGYTRTVTPHSGFMIFVYDYRRREHHIFVGYSIPRRSDEERAEAFQNEATISTDMSEVTNKQSIAIKVSWKYFWTMPDNCSKMIEERFDIANTSDFLLKLSHNSACTFRVAKLASLLTEEAALCNLQQLSLAKQQLCLRPAQFATCSTFDVEWAPEQANGIFRQFKQIIFRYTGSEDTVSQLRVCMAFILQLCYAVSSSSLPPTSFFLPIAGPSGGGKTRTLARTIVLSRSLPFLKEVFTVLANLQASINLLFDDNLAGRVSQQRVIYCAATNDDVDRGCLAIEGAIGQLAKAGVTETPQVVRVCGLSKLSNDGILAPLHVWNLAARELLKDSASEHSKWTARLEAIKSRNHERRIQGSNLKKSFEARGLEAKGEAWKTELALVTEEVDNRHSDASNLSSEESSQYDQFTVYRKFLADFIENTASYTHRKDQVGAEKIIKPVYRSQLQIKTAAIMRDPSVICCFTAGYVNPYHPELVASCAGTVVCLDEASKCSPSDLVTVMADSTSLLLCRDINYTGTVLMAKPSGNLDARRPVMSYLSSQTLGLSMRPN